MEVEEMYLKKLKLHNFRCFEQMEIEFHDRLTVIVGANGAGKTTILEAAAVAAGTLLYSFDGIRPGKIDKDDAHNKYYSMGSVIDVQAQYPVEIIADGNIAGNSISWTRTLNSENGKTTVVDAKKITAISEEYQKRLMKGDTSLVLPVIAYYGTGRMWDYHREKKNDTFKKNTRTNGYIDCLDGTANVKLMLNWFKKMAWSDGQKDKPSPEYLAVRSAMEHCFSVMTGIEEVNVRFNPDTSEIDVVYQDTHGEKVKIPLNRLSDGYKGTISLIADIAYRMAVLNPQLSEHVLTETEGIVLLDEVDLHLHPAWQQRVISDLTSIFPKVQFIVSTHAPAVIHSVKSENLIVLKDYQVLRVNSQVYGKDIKAVLNEIMGVTERPPEVSRLFDEFYMQLAKKDFDLAEGILNQIDELRDYHDQEVVGCRVKLKLERMRGGQR